MKLRILMMTLIMCLTGSTFAFAYADVSKEEALAAVSKQFLTRDVDYYILENEGSQYWTIFVDAEPMKGWEHECHIFLVSKTKQSSSTNAIILSKEERKLPPAGNFVPLQIKNRYLTTGQQKPYVTNSISSNTDLSAAGRTYAIILSGGVNKISNHERYWNDCSFIYQTLTMKYGVPKENIFPLMSDGNNPGEDMRTVSGRFVSQSLDLDHDGVNEIKLAATKANISSTLGSLQSKLKKDDHLFIFVIDHGGTTDNKTNSYICLWNYENLYDYELENMLKPFTSKLVNVNVVLGQCFAGGFNDNLTKVGCVVASACTGSESSWACADIPYDEFVYQWTCAVNEANHNKNPLKADIDNNGRVTMDEAFKYAKANDRVKAEHPQYVSTPISVGEDLAFNHLAPSVDLYIKDNDEDTGKEPNTTTENFWKSPSICVRNQDDGIFKHENPIYAKDHRMAFIYVRIENRGKEAFNGEGRWLIAYWTKASPATTSKSWKGRELINGKYPSGGAIEAMPIPPIEAGKDVILIIPWKLPNMMAVDQEDDFHYCLMAKIMDTQYDDGFDPEKPYFRVLACNDQAQRNVTIIKNDELGKYKKVFIRNISSQAKSYTLELIPQTESDADFYARGKIELEMSPNVYAAWERGGFECQNLDIPTDNAVSRKVKFISPQSQIKKISLKGDEFDVVKLKFNKLRTYTNNFRAYTFDLIQKDEDGNIIGGETFVIEPTKIIDEPIIIEPITTTPGEYELGVEQGEYKSIKWHNSEGDNIGNGNSITVKPTYGNNVFSVIAVTADDEMISDSVTLENEFGIKSVSIDAGKMTVSLKTPAAANSQIAVTPLIEGGLETSMQIPQGEDSVTIDTKGLPSGMYAVSYSVEHKTIDSVKTTIDN